MPRPEHQPPLNRERRRVLVVEDDEATRRVLAAVLEDEGYAVLGVANGVEALQWIPTWQPHVILLDLVMPASNGFMFANTYHRLPGPHAPIVVLSAVARDAGSVAAATGAAEVLPKPLDVERLLQVVSVLSRPITV
jgi:CheY-like chemotaxis protein